MTSTEHNPAVHYITAADLKAIKDAVRWQKNRKSPAGVVSRTTLIVDWRAERPDWNKGQVTVSTDVDLPDGYEPSYSSVRYEIPAMGGVADYGNEKPTRCVTSKSHYSWGEDGGPLLTLANILRVGDALSVKFTLCNNTANLEEASMVHDSCFIYVVRNNKYIVECYVNDVVCPKSSWGARMNDGFRSWVAS